MEVDPKEMVEILKQSKEMHINYHELAHTIHISHLSSSSVTMLTQVAFTNSPTMPLPNSMWLTKDAGPCNEKLKRASLGSTMGKCDLHPYYCQVNNFSRGFLNLF